MEMDTWYIVILKLVIIYCVRRWTMSWLRPSRNMHTALNPLSLCVWVFMYWKRVKANTVLHSASAPGARRYLRHISLGPSFGQKSTTFRCSLPHLWLQRVIFLSFTKSVQSCQWNDTRGVWCIVKCIWPLSHHHFSLTWLQWTCLTVCQTPWRPFRWRNWSRSTIRQLMRQGKNQTTTRGTGSLLTLGTGPNHHLLPRPVFILRMLSWRYSCRLLTHNHIGESWEKAETANCLKEESAWSADRKGCWDNWMTEWVSDRLNKWRDECMTFGEERRSEWFNDWLKDRMTEWIHDLDMPSDCKIAGHCKAFSQPSLSQNQEAVPVRLGTTTAVADGASRAHLLPRFFQDPRNSGHTEPTFATPRAARPEKAGCETQTSYIFLPFTRPLCPRTLSSWTFNWVAN
jgi:hypothetical protein